MSKAVIALTLATVASASASTYLWRELGAEREQTVALQTRVAQLERAQTLAAAPPRAESEPQQPEIERAPEPATPKPAVAQTAPAPIFGFAPAARLGVAGPDPDMRRRMMETHEQQLRLLKDPEYRELMRSQQKLGMAQMYSDLEPLLGLTKEESERLLDVLAEQSLRNMELRPSFGTMDGAPPSETEIRERQRLYEEQRRRNESEIAAVLGSRYSDWQEYQNNGWSRSQVTRLRQTLSSTDEPLRQDQIKPLVDAIAREQQQVMRAPMRSTTPGTRPDAQAQARMAEEWLERTAQSHERIQAAVSGLLTPSQFEQLQRQQEQELKMQELSVKQQRARAEAIARGELPPDAPGTMSSVITYAN